MASEQLSTTYRSCTPPPHIFVCFPRSFRCLSFWVSTSRLSSRARCVRSYSTALSGSTSPPNRRCLRQGRVSHTPLACVSSPVQSYIVRSYISARLPIVYLRFAGRVHINPVSIFARSQKESSADFQTSVRICTRPWCMPGFQASAFGKIHNWMATLREKFRQRHTKRVSAVCAYISHVLC